MIPTLIIQYILIKLNVNDVENNFKPRKKKKKCIHFETAKSVLVFLHFQSDKVFSIYSR